jgi:hypothetical protein
MKNMVALPEKQRAKIGELVCSHSQLGAASKLGGIAVSTMIKAMGGLEIRRSTALLIASKLAEIGGAK